MAAKNEKPERDRSAEVRRRQKRAVRNRMARGESKLRVKGDLGKVSEATRKKLADEKKRKMGIDPVGVRSVITGGLPGLGKGSR